LPHKKVKEKLQRRTRDAQQLLLKLISLFESVDHSLIE